MATNRNTNKGAIETITSSTQKVNNFLVDTTEMIVDETIDRAAGWQNVADKAIKGGFQLADKQSDIAFKALEMLKKQWFKGQQNFKERVSN